MLVFAEYSNNALSSVHIDGPHVGKFPNDCVFYENDDIIIITEGYILGSEELLNNSDTPSLGKYIADMYAREPEQLLRTLKGSFAAAIIDKSAQRIFIFNDLLSKRPVYYYCKNNIIAFSTRFLPLVNYLTEHGVSLSIDPLAITQMTASGRLFESTTYCREISYLKPFYHLDFVKGILTAGKTEYPALNHKLTKNAAIEELNRLLLDATRLQFQKNLANNYPQISSLSGGMDSRVVLEYGLKNGFSPDLTFTYAESNSDDMRIARKIADRYGFENRFQPLDGGNFMLNRDELITRNEGLIIYCGTTGLLNSIKKSLLGVNPGIVHSGIGGGEILGDICLSQDGKTSFDMILQYFDKLGISGSTATDIAQACADEYPDFNTFRNIQDLRNCVNFARTAHDDFEVASPFLYEDVFCFMLTVPFELKHHRTLYRELYRRHININIPVTHYGKISRGHKFSSMLKNIFTRAFNRFLGDKLKKHIKLRRDMNPYYYWEKTNPQISPALSEMFREDMKKLSSLDSNLSDNLCNGFKGDIFHKLRTLTATWTLIKLHEMGL